MGSGDVSGGGVYVAADQEYNALEIVWVVMGYPLIDTPVATPNRYSYMLVPLTKGGSKNFICIDIITIARREEPFISPRKFACS